MKTQFLPSVLFIIATSAVAADLPKIPEQPIAVKNELLFADDFESAERPHVWHKVVPTFVFECGALKGVQIRYNSFPASDGKPTPPAHAACHRLEVPTTNSVVE